MKTLNCTIIILLGCICAVFTACKDDYPIVQPVTPYEKQYGEAAVVWECSDSPKKAPAAHPRGPSSC